MIKQKKLSVLFVCLGNICRSPTAHAVFRKCVSDNGLSNIINIDSAGTGDWHIGRPPDRRSSEKAKEFGYDLSDLRARLVEMSDFENFSYILVMDSKNLADVRKLAPKDHKAKIELLLNYSARSRVDNIYEVPDPYFGGEDGFDHVLDLIEDATLGFLNYLKANYISELE
jgi:protein-tyrosine phosphatase